VLRVALDVMGDPFCLGSGGRSSCRSGLTVHLSGATLPGRAERARWSLKTEQRVGMDPEPALPGMDSNLPAPMTGIFVFIEGVETHPVRRTALVAGQTDNSN
jgi:hypothetical protein